MQLFIEYSQKRYYSYLEGTTVVKGTVYLISVVEKGGGEGVVCSGFLVRLRHASSNASRDTSIDTSRHASSTMSTRTSEIRQDPRQEIRRAEGGDNIRVPLCETEGPG